MIRRFASAFLRRNPRPDTHAMARGRDARHGGQGAELRAHQATFDFVEKLARALHRYGCTAPALEDALITGWNG